MEPLPAAPPAPAPARLPPPEPFGGWFELVLYLAGGFGVFALASLALWPLQNGASLATSAALYTINVLCFAGAAYFLGVRRQRLTWAEFGLRPFSERWLWAALWAAVLLLPVRALAALAVQALAGDSVDALAARQAVMIPGGASPLTFLVTLLGAGVAAPAAEELYFRGLIHRWFWARFAFWPRVLASSLLFGLGHFDTLGVVASSFFLGLLAAVAYERSRSLWLAIIIHAVNNSFAISLLYVAAALDPGAVAP